MFEFIRSKRQHISKPATISCFCYMAKKRNMPKLCKKKYKGYKGPVLHLPAHYPVSNYCLYGREEEKNLKLCQCWRPLNSAAVKKKICYTSKLTIWSPGIMICCCWKYFNTEFLPNLTSKSHHKFASAFNNFCLCGYPQHVRLNLNWNEVCASNFTKNLQHIPLNIKHSQLK